MSEKNFLAIAIEFGYLILVAGNGSKKPSVCALGFKTWLVEVLLFRLVSKTNT